MNEATLRRLTKVPLIGRAARNTLALRALTAQLAQHDDFGVTLQHDGIPVPPMRMRDMVRKGALFAEDFVAEGRQVHDVLTGLLTDNGVTDTAGLRVYEFGVGCGRVARHFLSAGQASFSGSDVDEELVQWCKAHLRGSGEADFFTNTYAPPIAKIDAAFDLAYSISVFTHMNAENQAAWMGEMARILAPGGHLAVSILERSEADLPGGIEIVQRIDREFKRTWLGKDGAPTVYYNTYNTVRHFSGLAAGRLDLIDQRRDVIRGKQTLLLFRKRI